MPLSLLSAVYQFPEEQLKEALLQLAAVELIYRQTDPPNESYKFKHALVQDAAYATLLRPQRKELHARIAKALEERFTDRAATEPEVLAYHFSQAGLVAPAIKYWQAAGQRATERAASVEAVAYFDKALALLRTMPETPERDQQELMLLVGRGLPLTAIGSYAAADVGDNYRAAHALCKRMGAAPKIFPVLQGLYRFYLVGAELQMALDTTTQLLDVAEKAKDQNLLMEAHQAQAFSLGFRGELQSAQEHFDKCMALLDPERFRGRMHLYTTDTATSALSLGALIAWLRGYPDRSAAITEQALARARAVDHPYTLAWMLSNAAVLYQLRGDAGMTRHFAEECVCFQPATRLSILAGKQPHHARLGAREARRAGSGGDRRFARWPGRLEQDGGTDLHAIFHVLSGGRLSGGRATRRRSGSAHRDHRGRSA